MANIRAEKKDYGGVLCWDDASPDKPVYLAEHLLATHWDGAALTVAGQNEVDAAIVALSDAAAKEALLDKIKVAEEKIQIKLGGLFDDAREYVENNPGVSGQQLKTAFVNQLKTWVANWTGE